MKKIYPVNSDSITGGTCSGRHNIRAREAFVTHSRVIFLSLLLGLLLINATEVRAQIALRGTATSATTTNTTLTINKPAGVVAGDVMIVNITQRGNTSTNASGTGWTLVAGARQSTGTRYSTVLYRVAGSTEGTSYTFSLPSGTTSAVGSIIAFSGVDASVFDVTPGSFSVGGSTTITATGITTITNNAAVVFLAGAGGSDGDIYSNWTGTTPTINEVMDFSTGVSTNNSVGAAWGIRATAGATGSRTVTVDGNYYWAGILVALRPQPPISITTGTITGAPFCVSSGSGASVSVPFTSVGTFTSNTYTAQLSDASGSFTSPVSIGTLVSDANSGTISATIPAGTASGTGYRIRVISSSPAITGSSSSAIEIINGAANVTSPAASSGNTQATLTWTNPSGCFDEIMIVAKAGSAVSSPPSGDGSAYTGNPAFGSGTAFDGGFVVYKGSASSQTVTALTNGTTYHFTFFTRFGTTWSSGTTVTAVPSLATSGDYRSNAVTMNWNTAASWEIYNGSNWVTATSSPTSTNANTITICNGHTVSVTANVLVDQVIVESGGKVTMGNYTLTINQGEGDDFVVNGTVELNGTSGTTGLIITNGNLVFNSGSHYYHRRPAGTIPTATWNPGSTCHVEYTTDATAYPVGFNQAFWNFTWDYRAGSNLYGNGFTQTSMQILGDLTIEGTGTKDIGFSNNTDPALNVLTVGGNLNILTGAIYRVCYNYNATLNVLGNVNISGGTLVMNSSDNNTTGDRIGTATVDGNFTITNSGTLNFAENGRETRVGDLGILNVKGNFSHDAGTTITELSTVVTGNVINFAGTGIQYYSSGGTVANTVNFNVSSGAYLQMAAESTAITGGGTFTLESGATLGITSANGITSTGASGNVQVTGTRTYDTGANYIYNGTAAQVTGNGLPATVNSLVFNNAGGAVTFSSACAVTNDFSITTGSKANLGTELSHSAGTLTLGGIAQIGCSYGSSSSTSAVIKNNTYFEGTGVVVTGTCPSGLWIGAASTNWHLDANWSLGGSIPNENTDVIIPSGAPNQPECIPNSTALCRNITINSGASLTINPLGRLTSNSINNSGNLILESDNTGSASLIVNTYSGNPANIELYLTGDPNVADNINYWHYISSPVNGTNEHTFFDDNDATWDLAHFKEDISLSLFPSQTLYNWQMSWVGYDGWSYFDGSPTGFLSSPMVIGKGYNFWDETTTTYTLSGSINTQEISQPITFTDRGVGNEGFEGFNLLGNPFSSGLNINTMFSSGWPANAYRAVYFTSNGQPLVYSNGVQVPSDNIPGYIPPMQGFFIKTDAAGSFIFPLVARAHTSVNHYKKGDETPISLLRLSISENGKSDETVVRFDNSAKSGADYNFDAPRFMASPDNPGIYTTINGQDFTINGQPFPDSSVEIPLVVNLLNTGIHTINTLELEKLNDYSVLLKDKVTNSSIDIKSVREYSFSAQAGLLKDRFILTVSNLSTAIEDPENADNLFNIYAGFDLINIQPLSDQWDGKTGSVKLMDISGKTVRNQPNTEFMKNSVIQLPSPGNGIYFVEIRSGIMRYVGKVVVK